MVALNTLLFLLGLTVLEGLANPIGTIYFEFDLTYSDPAQVAELRCSCRLRKS